MMIAPSIREIPTRYPGNAVSDRTDRRRRSVFYQLRDIGGNLENPVELGDLDQAQDLFLHPRELHCAAVFAHFPFRDEKGAQAAAVAEIDFRQVDDQLFDPGFAEKEEFSLQLRRDGR